MNLIDALRSERKIRRTGKHNWTKRFARAPFGRTTDGPGNSADGWYDPDQLLEELILTRDDILANDWEIELSRAEKPKEKTG